MVKGFILYKKGKIPFVIEKYRMELFTDDKILNDFMQEHNKKKNYILSGVYFSLGTEPRKITILVERSLGSTCYLSCYIVENLHVKEGYNEIGIQSSYLDDVFRYKYNYIDLSRTGINFAVDIKEVYSIPFEMEDNTYNLKYCIGHNGNLGLLEDFERNGEVRIRLKEGTILECAEIVRTLHRFSMFMNSQVDVSFKRIALYNDGILAGWFCSDNICEDNISVKDVMFFELDVMKYVPKILNNIAQDCGNKITRSVPLGHLSNAKTEYSPQRFIEQVMAFEYLFEKIEPEKAKSKSWTLKKELVVMFDSFPKILEKSTLNSQMVSEEIKKTRIDIVHGYAYYYDFASDNKLQYIIIQFDKLIKAMSLKWMGFSNEEIMEFLRL